MFMVPGLALFYGGLVRAKNVLGTVMQSLIALGVVSVLWVSSGTRSPSAPITGSSGARTARPPRRRRRADGARADGAGLGVRVFQLMFAVITPALITGAFAERMRFGGYLLFLGLWSVLVYAPVAHWVWGGGFLGASGVGALDFAGGTVVHVNAGAAALAAALYLGRRRGFGTARCDPTTCRWSCSGAGILWFGWFGFNAGSALSAGGLASSAFVATHLGAALGMLGWLVPERIRHRRATTIGAATGAVAGLVAIDAGLRLRRAPAGARDRARRRRGLLPRGRAEDPARARRFARRRRRPPGRRHRGRPADRACSRALVVNPAGAQGGLAQVGRQAVAVGVTLVFSFVATMAILRVVDRLVGLRVSAEVEEEGLDRGVHGETAYAFSDRIDAARTLPFDPDEELARLREQMVAEATRRTIQALTPPIRSGLRLRRRRGAPP